jgi:hypothetical protein
MRRRRQASTGLRASSLGKTAASGDGGLAKDTTEDILNSILPPRCDE